jgi:hypothetical protein
LLAAGGVLVFLSAWLFQPGQFRSRWDAIRWWEARRIIFNLLVGLTGVIATGVFLLIGRTIVQPGEDFEEPLALIGAVLVYGFMANVCYTLGWITELAWAKDEPAKSQDFRVRAFRAGLIFSIALTTAPVWIATFVWLLYKIKMVH